MFQTSASGRERRPRVWRNVAILLVIIVALVFGATYLLRESHRATPVAQSTPAVDATTVDVKPASPSSPAPSSPASSETLPAGSPTQHPRGGGPAPTPSRPVSGSSADAASPARTPSARGGVLIRSTPTDADVLVNGQARGKTPLTLRDLPFGSYTIRIARGGYTTEEREIQLTSQRPTASMVVTLRETSRQTASGTGGINVQSRPSGARVFVNDRRVGSTPLAVPNLPAGSVTVRLEMDGYSPWQTRVRVSPGEQTKVAGSLDRR